MGIAEIICDRIVSTKRSSKKLYSLILHPSKPQFKYLKFFMYAHSLQWHSEAFL